MWEFLEDEIPKKWLLSFIIIFGKPASAPAPISRKGIDDIIMRTM